MKGKAENTSALSAEFQVHLEFGGRTEVMQKLLGSVLRGLEVEELLVLIDELGVHGGVKELVVGQYILEEGDVGLEKRRGECRKRKNSDFFFLTSHMNQSNNFDL